MSVLNPKGYRTYISIAVIVLHQVANHFGLVELTGEDISLVIDGVAGIAAILFRKAANAPQK